MLELATRGRRKKGGHEADLQYAWKCVAVKNTKHTLKGAEQGSPMMLGKQSKPSMTGITATQGDPDGAEKPGTIN